MRTSIFCFISPLHLLLPILKSHLCPHLLVTLSVIGSIRIALQTHQYFSPRTCVSVLPPMTEETWNVIGLRALRSGDGPGFIYAAPVWPQRSLKGKGEIRESERGHDHRIRVQNDAVTGLKMKGTVSQARQQLLDSEDEERVLPWEILHGLQKDHNSANTLILAQWDPF